MKPVFALALVGFLNCCATAVACVDVYVGVDYGTGSSAAWTVTGYKCVFASSGCPFGSTMIDPSTGDVAGCTASGGTPPTIPPRSCTGNCSMCEGGVTAGDICKKAGPTDTCTGGTVGKLGCGKKATMSCMIGGANAGPNGCGCPTPATYPPGTTCSFSLCNP